MRVVVAVLLIAPAHAAGASNVGMNIHVGHEGFLDACRELGVGWVRMDANWFHVEPADDEYNWSHLDTWIARAAADGPQPLEVFLTLAYTPHWVPRHGDTDGIAHNDVPDDASEWIEFVEAAVTRYRAAGVTHYGLWNEPNLGHFFEGSVEEYVDLILVPGAAAVRRVCADCRVLGPDLAHVGAADDYLEAVLTRAPADTFDIIAHHSYHGFAETGWQFWDGDSYINVLDQQRLPLTRRSLRQVLDRVGYHGEVWMTETGYRAHPAGDIEAENLQSVHVRRVLEEQLARPWYTNTFFYEIHDCGPDQPTCDIDGFGLMRAESGAPGARQFPDDYRLKPAFVTLRQFISEHPQIVGVEPLAPDGGRDDGDAPVDAEGAPREGGERATPSDPSAVGDALPAGDPVVTDTRAADLTGSCSAGGSELWLLPLFPWRRRAHASGG